MLTNTLCSTPASYTPAVGSSKRIAYRLIKNRQTITMNETASGVHVRSQCGNFFTPLMAVSRSHNSSFPIVANMFTGFILRLIVDNGYLLVELLELFVESILHLLRFIVTDLQSHQLVEG